MKVLFTIISPFQPDISLSCVDSETHLSKNRSLRFFVRKNVLNPLTDKKEPTGLFTLRELFVLEDLLADLKEKMKAVLISEMRDPHKVHTAPIQNKTETDKLFDEMARGAKRKKAAWDD